MQLSVFQLVVWILANRNMSTSNAVKCKKEFPVKRRKERERRICLSILKPVEHQFSNSSHLLGSRQTYTSTTIVQANKIFGKASENTGLTR